jgi:hypothetical protein
VCRVLDQAPSVDHDLGVVPRPSCRGSAGVAGPAPDVNPWPWIGIVSPARSPTRSGTMFHRGAGDLCRDVEGCRGLLAAPVPIYPAGGTLLRRSVPAAGHAPSRPGGAKSYPGPRTGASSPSPRVGSSSAAAPRPPFSSAGLAPAGSSPLPGTRSTPCVLRIGEGDRLLGLDGRGGSGRSR